MTYRVIQWATGAMGKACLRTVIDHPGTELVGVYVYSADKVGKDAGEIALRPATGVLATNDVEQILALDADVVVHAGQLKPYVEHTDDYVKLLASGKNVISLNGYSHPKYWGDERTARLEAACLAGGASLMGSGLNPGVVGEQIAVTASGMCSSLEHIAITEAFDCTEIRSPHYLFTMLGFGADPAASDPNDPSWGPTGALNPMYEEEIAAIAFRLGMTLDRIESDHRLFGASRDLTLKAGEVPRGRVSHTQWRWHGVVRGVRMITLTINWFVETAHLDDFPVGADAPDMWTVEITGQPCVRLTTNLAKHPDDLSRMGAEQYAVGGMVVNAMPYLVSAPPGILTRAMTTPFRADLGQP